MGAKKSVKLSYVETGVRIIFTKCLQADVLNIFGFNLVVFMNSVIELEIFCGIVIVQI